MMMDVVGETSLKDTNDNEQDENAQTIESNTNDLNTRETNEGQKPTVEEKPLSKNQQKKLKRKQDWEDGREERKIRRREKTKERKQRKREAREHEDEQSPQRSLSKTDGASEPQQPGKVRRSVTVPLTILYDCEFDSYMNEAELISLGQQITRAYSDNKKAKYRTHVVVSSFGGRMRERFDGLLQRTHESWRGIRFLTDGWQECAKLAKKWMREGKQCLAPAWNRAQKANMETHVPEDEDEAQAQDVKIVPINGADISTDVDGSVERKDSSSAVDDAEIVYLTSDSPDTLSVLKPYSTYIIGGIVDKNRHKGLCYKRACDASVRTAKLPIGDYLKMSSRAVLTTNQVGEIMLRWLECGDWGEAFVSVIPERKGAVLRKENAGSNSAEVNEHGKTDAVNEADSSGR